jgi:transcriptional regulator with XRE-family HTH domain
MSGTELRQLRETAGLSQRELAALAGIPPSYVAFYERAAVFAPQLEGAARRALQERATACREALR